MRRPARLPYVGVMSLRTRFFALTYDRQIAKTEKAGLRAFRERLLAGASGDVLEIGGGTGANLPWYGPAVTSLTITEPQRPDRPVLQAAPDLTKFSDIRMLFGQSPQILLQLLGRVIASGCLGRCECRQVRLCHVELLHPVAHLF